MYFSTHDIHVPRVPNARFIGTSECGVRGDAITQLDWCVGQIRETLARLNLAENTMVIFTSDNGPMVDDGYADGAAEALGDHKPSGPWRGEKYSIFEGGTRLPFIVEYPAVVKPGVSDALVCQIDLIASLSSLTDIDLPQQAAADSKDVLPALLGHSSAGRTWLIEEAKGLAIRKNNWKLIPPHKGVDTLIMDEEGRPWKKTGLSIPQLYYLADDPGETTNIADQYPNVVLELMEMLSRLVNQKPTVTLFRPKLKRADTHAVLERSSHANRT
jgi:arylsulfatase A-like enzyme